MISRRELFHEMSAWLPNIAPFTSTRQFYRFEFIIYFRFLLPELRQIK